MMEMQRSAALRRYCIGINRTCSDWCVGLDRKAGRMQHRMPCMHAWSPTAPEEGTFQ